MVLMSNSKCTLRVHATQKAAEDKAKTILFGNWDAATVMGAADISVICIGLGYSGWIFFGKGTALKATEKVVIKLQEQMLVEQL